MSRAVAVYHGIFGRATLYELDRPMTTHAHREGHLIFFVEGNPGRVIASRRPVQLGWAQAAAINPWEPHAFEPPSYRTSGVYLVLYINPAWFAGIGGLDLQRLCFGRPDIKMTAGLNGLVADISTLLLAQAVTPQFDRLLFDLTHLSAVHSWPRGPQRESATAAMNGRIDFRIRKSMQLLSDRLDQEPPLDAVARDSGLSRPHFYKLFKAHTGITPNLYFNTLRMERAIEFVAGSDRSITSIGQALGFSCQSVFTRFFSSHVGMPPSDYRRVVRVLNG